MTVGAGDTDGGTVGPPNAATLTGPGLTTVAPAAALRPDDPRRVGAYTMLGRLGEGGMGTVYLGRAADGRLVAVKVIRAEFSRDARFRARFRAEANAARRVARFCTAQVLDVDTDADLAYLVTEYIDGPTLATALDQDGPLHGSMLDSLAIGVAAALNGIHAAGVVHRDLKPSNVLLSRLGPKVIDFGIARALDELDGLTNSGQVVGTPAYMAPEQFSGTATAATDVFTWGSVVTFAGTGHTPFGSGSLYELMYRVTSGEPDLSGLDGPLRDLVARALSKQPEQRPTARALLLALVGDVDDLVDASDRILSTTWQQPPPLAPTLLDDRRRTRSRVMLARILGAAAVAAVVLVSAVLLSDRWRGPAGAGRSTQSPSASVTSSAPAGSTPSTTKGATDSATRPPAGDSVTLGTRVPPSGFETLAFGDVHTYRFRLPAARKVTLDMESETCAHLIPWAIVGVTRGPVGQGTLRCDKAGPYSLAAGDYELRIGREGVDGRYAFQIVGV